MQLPVRVRVQDPASFGKDIMRWIDIPRDTSISVTPDGYIWLEGLTDNSAGTLYSILDHDIDDIDAYDEGKSILRRFKMNIAFPTDVRVKGYKHLTNLTFDQGIRDAFYETDDTLLRLIDSPDAYHRVMQINSHPAFSPKYYGGLDGTDAHGSSAIATQSLGGLTRDLPPGSEVSHANYAAYRALAKMINPVREASFKLIGCQPIWRAGDRISEFQLYYPEALKTVTYQIRSCCTSVTTDFLGQITSVGGIMSEFGSQGGV
jgi:hypothetical protein